MRAGEDLLETRVAELLRIGLLERHDLDVRHRVRAEQERVPVELAVRRVEGANRLRRGVTGDRREPHAEESIAEDALARRVAVHLGRGTADQRQAHVVGCTEMTRGQHVLPSALAQELHARRVLAPLGQRQTDLHVGRGDGVRPVRARRLEREGGQAGEYGGVEEHGSVTGDLGKGILPPSTR